MVTDSVPKLFGVGHERLLRVIQAGFSSEERLYNISSAWRGTHCLNRRQGREKGKTTVDRGCQVAFLTIHLSSCIIINIQYSMTNHRRQAAVYRLRSKIRVSDASFVKMYRLTVSNLLHGAVISNVNIHAIPISAARYLTRQSSSILPIRVVVHGHHVAALDHAVRLWELGFGKRLLVHQFSSTFVYGQKGESYSGVSRVANLLAHELVGPVVVLVLGVGHEAWYYERHVW